VRRFGFRLVLLLAAEPTRFTLAWLLDLRYADVPRLSVVLFRVMVPVREVLQVLFRVLLVHSALSSLHSWFRRGTLPRGRTLGKVTLRKVSWSHSKQFSTEDPVWSETSSVRCGEPHHGRKGAFLRPEVMR
jgi:hypothetical protein